MKRFLLLLIPFLLLGTLRLSATHIVGGELVYTYLGGSQYAITLIVYRDCLSGQAAFDNPAAIGIFNSSNTLVQDLNFTLDSVVTLQSTINSSCVTAPNNVCTEAGYYTEIVTLPPIVGGYTIAYQRCCRNAVVQNIVDPGNVGATYVATIPGSESQPANSSPIWSNLPPLYVCANLPFQFDHSAFDLDGDSLVYSLCTPYEGASSTAPQPNPPSSPPYTPISWQAPYSLNDMMGGVPLTINPQTGQLNAVPNAIGTYVIGICVSQYRNGILLGETRRGIQINVVNCQAPVASPDDLNEIIPNSFINCTEYVEFQASSSSGFNILWDFGDPTTTSDQSTNATTSWTYPGPGSYDLTLVVYNPINPSDPLCTDTVVQTITVQDTVIPDAGPDVATCPGIPVQIGAAAIPGWTYQWSPTTGLNDPNSSQPTASITGQITYVLTATDAVGCTGSDSVTVSLLPNTSANAGPDVQICSGDSIQLQASGGVDYQWSPNQFIDDVNISDPNVFPPSDQAYVVSVTNADGCIGTDTVLVQLFQSVLTVSSDVTICVGDTTQLSVAGAITYAWSPVTDISDPNIADPEVWPSTTTTYVVEAVDANGCEVTDSVVVSVQPLPLANAGQDVEICVGECVPLQASGGDSYAWSPSIGLSDPNSSNPTACPDSTTTYVVTVTSSLQGSGQNLVVNGDFELGNIGFTTDYTEFVLNPPPPPNITFGQYVVVDDLADIQQSWSGLGDHTSGTGNFMVADGATTPGQNFWCQTVSVSPNTWYDLSAWIATVFVNPNSQVATLRFTVNGTPVGNDFVAPWPFNQWQEFSATWYSGSATTATICMTDLVTVGSGNDFALDDLFFGPQTPGCSSTDTITVTVNPLPAVNAGADQTLCFGQTVQLTASGADTYLWYPGTGLSDSTVFNPNAQPSLPTEYVVEGTDANGCSNTDTVFVDVFLVDAIGDTVICIGDEAQLSVVGGVSWSWSPTTGLSDASVQNPTANPTTTTVYTVTADDGSGCLATDTVTVVVSQLPIAFAGFDQGVCAGSTAQLNASGGVSYEWQPTSGLSNPNIAAPIVTFSSDTVTYWVTVTDNIGCENTDTVTIWQEPLPNAVAGPDTTVCAGQSVQLTSSGGTTYSWSPAAGLNNPNAQNPTATPLTTTTYTVTVGQPTGNLIFNGDFSQGNVGFNSDYTYYDGPPNMGEALFSVVANANSIHNAFQGTGHTGNAPVDSFMVVNGAGTPNQNVWCQTISVSPNTDYFFGAWVSTVVASSPAILQFSINGQVLGAPFSAPFNINNWSQFYQTWNSGTATTATICVVNQNTNTGGNDFALDDITFSTYCTNTAEVTVTINPLPEADAGEDQQICYGDTTQLEGAGGVTYAWVPPIGIADPTDPTTDAYPNLTTTYTLIVEDNIGCTDTDEMTLTVNPLPAANAGPDHEVCIGESVILEGSGGTIYQWTPQTYLDDATAQLPVSTAEQTTTYTVTVTDNNNCTDSDSTTVTVNPLPIVEAGPDSMICANGSLVLQGNGAASYAWTPLIGLSDPQSATPTASPLSPTTYYVTGTDINGCIGSDSVSITIFGITAWPDSVICQNDSVQAFVSGGVSFSWSPSEGVSDTASSSPYLSPFNSTAYTVTVLSAYGCAASAEVDIDILTLPVSGFTAEFEPTCDGIYADFSNTSENSETFYWSFGDGGTSTEFEPTHTFEPGVGSIVTLITYNNDSLCVDSSVVDFSGQWFGNDTIDIKYGNVFTPNYDGINDCFKPGFDGRFSDCYDLKVYNRWGALIFESTGGQNHCWDGRTKGGKPCDEGTYYYIVSLKGYENHGYVTLIY
ncbi:MAG: gliding motility-associated C-terminal domain-containing protein [Flavobacteriales bacterium]|nr:gliding motility-associated C-terminal domain-containing protein [Flavobacteriales bacterium]